MFGSGADSGLTRVKFENINRIVQKVIVFFKVINLLFILYQLNIGPLLKIKKSLTVDC
jgi:hypothetical protein